MAIDDLPSDRGWIVLDDVDDMKGASAREASAGTASEAGPEAGPAAAQQATLEGGRAAGHAAEAVVRRLEAAVRAAGGVAIVAHWREEPVRPFGAFDDVIEDLAAWVQPRQPELLQRFGWFLVNLLYPWRRSAVTGPVGELRAGLADLALRGDQTLIHQFFQKRTVRPQMLSYFVQFVLESVSTMAGDSGRPVLVCLEEAHHADEPTLSALRLLNRYARYSRSALRLCVTGRRVPGSAWDAWLSQARAGDEWRFIEANDSEPVRDTVGEGVGGIGPDAASASVSTSPRKAAAVRAPGAEMETPPASADQREALAIATAFALPFTARDWSALLPDRLRHVPEDAGIIASLVQAGVLRAAGDDRLRFATAGARQRFASMLQTAASTREAAHQQLLLGGTAERDDPFAAAWHTREGGRDSAGGDAVSRAELQAMERAWAVSSYECAIAYAERALALDTPAIHADLLRGMLHYEAERYEVAHRYLTAALEQPPARLGRTVVEYLLGYNAVFGLNDFPRGIGILERVLSDYERTGDQRGAAYIRNSLAFAHFRSRHLDEAIDLEAENIDVITRANVSDSFLASILQLNLGRIYRNAGEAERALHLFRQGLHVRKGEPTSHVLLLFYATFAGLEFARGDYRASLAACHHALELVRDMQLDSVKDQVLQAWARGVPDLPREQTTRGDELRFYLHVHAGLACARLGLHDRADAYLAMVRHQRDLLGEQVVQAVDAAFAKQRAAATSLSATKAEDAASGHASQVGQEDADAAPSRDARKAAEYVPGDASLALDEISGAGVLLHVQADGDGVIDGVADAVLAGHVVAISRARAVAPGMALADTLILYDPRRSEIPERMTAEVGGSHIPRGTAALLLPEAIALFSDAAPLPLVQQTATLRQEHRSTYGALVPVRLCVQMLDRATDGWLFDLAARIAARGGPTLLGVAPYHLWRRDLAITPTDAIHAFLVSSIDELVVGDRLLQKRHGTSGVRNLSEFRPRLSEEALVYMGKGAKPGEEALLIRIKRRGGYATDELLKLHPSMRTMLDLCDGRHRVEEILDRVQPQRHPGGAGDERICTFLRTLWQRGALCFDEPLDEREPALADATVGPAEPSPVA